MEMQVVLIGAVVFVISAVLIYLISAFTMKEKTFEEVIAEQKKAQEEEELRAKAEKKAEKENKKRFKKKEKQKGDQSPKVAVQVPEEDHKMVNLELEPEIIEPVIEEKPKVRKRDKPAKSILHNKGEKGPIIADDFVEEVVHRGPVPKDDLELKLMHEKKEKPKKETKQKKADIEAKPKPVVEEIMKVAEVKVQAAAPTSVETKPNYNKSDGNNSKLISSVKSASLNDTEVQALIDVLLDKQGSAGVVSTDWSKKSQKGDPVALLRKQLEEKERSLQEEQQLAMTAYTKVKEVRQELNQEKTKFQAMEKSFKDKIDYQTREVQALTQRLQHAHDSHMVETTQLRGMVQKLESQAGDQGKIQRLMDENKTLRDSLSKVQSETMSAAEANGLKQKVSIMEKELSSNALKLNASENTKKTLEARLTKMEEEIKKYDTQQANSESVVSKRLEEISQELRKSEAKNISLSKDVKKSEQAVDAAHKECLSLKTELQNLQKALTESDTSSKEMEEKYKETNRQKSDMEGNLKNLQKRIEDYEKDKTEKLSEIQTLKQENVSLMTELKQTKELQQTAAQSKQAQNGDLHTEDARPTVMLEEHEKILSEKDSEISKLLAVVEGKKSELSNLQQEVEKQKKKNNDLREKNWKAMDALEKCEKSVSDKVQSAIKEKREELVAGQAEVEKFDKDVLQRLFPDISVSKNSHKDWMTEFEKQVFSHLSDLKTEQQQAKSDSSAKYEKQVNELESNLKDLEKRLQEAEKSRDSLQSSQQESVVSCEKLQSQVAQYRNVLGETENKLTQLENSVEAEEKKWQERLQNKDSELQQMTAEISSLRQELSSKSSGGQEQEMKAQVEDLEGKLKAAEARNTQLEGELKQTETKVTEYKIQIEEVQKTSASVTEISNDLEDLRKQLEAEKKKNKEMAANIVKLNGIIKTGHDALTQEQNLVKSLQTQLAAGDNKNSSELSNNNTTEATKAASQSSLNEAGTSV